MHFKIISQILRSRVCKPFPFIYNECHCKLSERNLSSSAKIVLSNKQKSAHFQRNLIYPVNKFLGNDSIVYLINTQFARFKSKTSKTQDDKDSDSESEDEIVEFREVSVKLATPNLESLLKQAMKFDKRKMLSLFDEEKIKLNKLKAYSGEEIIQDGDIVDISGESPLSESPTLLRLEIIQVETMDKTTKKHKVDIKKYPKYPMED